MSNYQSDISNKVSVFLINNFTEWNIKQKHELINLLEDQKRDTQLACADAVSRCTLQDPCGTLILKADAESACLNPIDSAKAF